MGWSRYFFHDFWTARRLNQIDAEFATVRRGLRRRRGASHDVNNRLAELESEVGRLALTLRGLVDTCVRKGHVTWDELEAQLVDLDAACGDENQAAPSPADEDGGDAALELFIENMRERRKRESSE